MELYWQNTPVKPGTFMQVEERDREVLNSRGKKALVTWEILEIKSRAEGDDYYDPAEKKTYPLQKLLKRTRLQRKKDSGALIHIPACTEYLVVREYHDNTQDGIRCVSVDMLGLLWDVKVL
ncbi:MAG: hypothetical protein ACLFNZ_11495 [Spirochaetaceae bacterium]